MRRKTIIVLKHKGSPIFSWINGKIKKAARNIKEKKIFYLLSYCVAIFVGVSIGSFLSVYRDVEHITTLENYQPSVMTHIYDCNGELLHQFAEEKRIVLPFKDIPQNFKNAIVSAEDNIFYHHIGFDPMGIMRAFYKNLIAGHIVQGASTITQQLSLNLFLTRELTYTRKIKEAFYAIQIENHYTKDQILELYCNQIFLGPNRYGVEAASRFYFGKSAKEMNIEECILLASIARSPERYNPFKHTERALKRRNHIINLMVKDGFLDKKEAEAIKKRPIKLRSHSYKVNFASYYIEEVRKFLVRKYGEKMTYQGGLNVYTTLNPEMQKIAYQALQDGLRAVDKRRGFRKISKNILKEGYSDIDSFQHASWKKPFKEEDIVYGVITAVDSKKAIARIGDYTAELGPYQIKWTWYRNPSMIFSVGDLIPLRIHKIDHQNLTLQVSLEQEPLVNGSLIAIEANTGKILAMVGGADFYKSQFNRATQAYRQTGSAFKPFVFAAALENGLSASTTIFDEPYTFYDPYTQKPYEVDNYNNSYYGISTLRQALEKSQNISTVKLHVHIGVDKVADFAKKFGFKNEIKPYLSLALGSIESTLIEMVAAYSAFPNQGVKVEPYFIERVVDKEGNILYQHQAKTRQVMSATTAYLIHKILEGVVQRGTAAKAQSLNRPIAGKTGTTNDFTDAWFIGYTPSLVAGVWIGFDEKKSLGQGQVGAVAALPIWIDLLEKWLNDKPIEYFTIPDGIVFRRIDKKTGLLATPLCAPEDIILEAYLKGNEPIEFCSEEMHRYSKLPYYLQPKKADINY